MNNFTHTPAETHDETHDVAADVTGAPVDPFATRLALFPDSQTGRVVPIDVPAPVDGSDPITCSFDKAAYSTSGFGVGSAALDWHTGAHLEQTFPDHEGFVPDGLGDENEPLMHTLRMYLPSRTVSTDNDISSWACIEQVVVATAPDVCRLPPSERGHYLGQLLTRWFSDGELPWQRFRIGAMLARYYEMIPDDAITISAPPVQRWVGWDTAYGVFLDVVDTAGWFHEHRRWLVTEALEFGNATWGEEFGGVRFLPLEEPTAARLFLYDGTTVPIKACDEFSHTCYDEYCCHQSAGHDD